MRFEVLGPMRVVVPVGPRSRVAVRPEPSLGGPKQRLVLARLLTEPNRVVSVDKLVDGLWGDDPPGSARHTVQSYVSELRKAVGPSIERDGVGYRIRVDRDTLDSLDFEARLADARTRSAVDPAGAADDLEAALGLWRGRAYDGLADEPFLAEAARLEELRLAAVEELLDARLAAGQHAGAIVELERLTREHPYRERFRALHMIALYRSGRQADALRAYQATRDVLGEELGIVPSPQLRRLEEQILLQDPDLDLTLRGSDGPDVAVTDSRWVENPYLGLRAFREADHSRFFGQDPLVGRLVDRVLTSARFTAVVGPSGSGKSSAVQAGLLPRLRRDHPELLVAQMQPGAQPLVTLEAALAPLLDLDVPASSTGRTVDRLLDRVSTMLRDRSARLLVVIDQFEELFTLADGAEASRFLALVADTVDEPGGHVHVLVTLRADFYDRPLADPRLGPLFADNIVNVVALGPDQLEAAAALPARQLDIAVEPRLVGRLIADVAGQPNALPLFQYALTELFDAREGAELDLRTYERIGGVRKAVARRAESLYGQFDHAEQESARQLFLRIVTVSGDIVGRRRVPASELISLDLDVVALRTAIDAFARYRLLALDRDPVTGSPTVEVAHEALLVEWHRLRGWIDEHRGDLAKQGTFAAAVNEWEASGRDPGYLLTGTRLDDYERWAATTGLRLTATEQDFLAAGVAAREADAAASLDREGVQARLRRRARRQMVLLFAVIAVCAGLLSYPLLATGPARTRVVVALDTRRADNASNELLARSVESAATELGFEAGVSEPPYTDVDGELRRIADDEPELMFGTFMMHERFLELADDHPETTFALIDSNGMMEPRPNVVAVRFAAEQGSFLVGAAAALESTTGKVGYLGANSQGFIEAFRAGFEQGAVAADPDIEVVSELIRPRLASGEESEFGYLDPEPAREIATAMYEDGVDIIYTAAGESGLGAIEAATELSRDGRHLWVIGVDTDQYYDLTEEQRAHVLTSMYKRFDSGVAAVLAAYDAGTSTVPPVITVTVADGAVGYTDNGGFLRPATIAALEILRAQLIEGTIIVDTSPANPPPMQGPPVLLDLRTGQQTPLTGDLARGVDHEASPDGEKLVFSTCCDDDEEMMVSNVDGTGARVLAAAEGHTYYGARWSPDGTKLVYQDRDTTNDDHVMSVGNLFVEDLASGQRTKLTDFDFTTENWWWMAPTFRPDGEAVIFHQPRDWSEGIGEWDVWSVPVTGGTPTLIVPDAMFADYLAGGTDIAFVSEMAGEIAGQSISIADSDGARRTLVDARSWIWIPRVSPDRTRIAYQDGGMIYVVDVSTGESTRVTRGDIANWFDDTTLIVTPP